MPNRIDTTISKARSEGRTVVGPYLTIGFPDVDTSVDIARAVLESGGDLLEFGVPFSDPLADGPTVQKTSFHALQLGVNLEKCLEAVGRLRAINAEVPIVVLCYYNPILRYGLSEFAVAASLAGLDGLIVPDLPPEEAGPLLAECDDRGVHIIPLLAPTSTDDRIALVCQSARGFIYCVGVTGVTGARAELQEGIADDVKRIRRHTELPVLIGFGVSRPEHVQAIGKFADGAIVGSALLAAIDGAPRGKAVQTAADFVKELVSRGRQMSS